MKVAGQKSLGVANVWSQFIRDKLRSLRAWTNPSHHNPPQSQARRWRLLQIESSLACNLRCVMCPWQEASTQLPHQGLMTPEIWQAIKPHLCEVRSVDLTGGGEPLLQPHLEAWLRDAKTVGCETGFLSNGVLLTPDRAQSVLDTGLDWICISMDGADARTYERIRRGARFEKVCSHLKHLAGLRGGKHPKLMINFVLMTLNMHQLRAMVQLAADLGVDQINFKQCDVIRGDQGRDLGLFGRKSTLAITRVQKELTKARRLARRLNLLTTAFAFTPTEQPVCDQDPRNSLFIRYNGTVAPCINLAIGGPSTFLGQPVHMPTTHYGRLPDTDLTDIWQTDPCQFYRDRFSQRVQSYDAKLVSGLIGVSGNRARTMEIARQAMPEAPQGCSVCHYLYNI